jgi:DNA-binding LacI/PurR family transcriptional regulator
VLNGKSNVSPQKRQSVKLAIQQTGYTPNEAATQMADLSAVKRRSKQRYDDSGH